MTTPRPRFETPAAQHVRRSDPLRDPVLRQHPVALVLLLHHWPDLQRDRVRIKVDVMADYFAACPKSVRRALRWLCRVGWLSVAGCDAHGSKLYALPDHATKGGHGAPVLPFRPIVSRRDSHDRAA